MQNIIDNIIITQIILVSWSGFTQYALDPTTKLKIKFINWLSINHPKPLLCLYCLGFWVSMGMIIFCQNTWYFVIFILNLIVIKLK